MAYKAVNSNLFHTPIWREEPIETRLLWITLIILQDNAGYIEQSIEQIEKICNLPHNVFTIAFNHLLGHESKIKRLIQLPNGFKIRQNLAIDNVKNNIKPLWRENTKEGYEAYLEIVDKAYYTIEKDVKWLKDMKEKFPRVLIGESLQNSYNNFWGTKQGWENKKRSKSNNIDMIKTIKNTIKINFVYLPWNESDYELSYITDLQTQYV